MPNGFDDEEYQSRYDDLDALLASPSQHEIWLSEVEAEFGAAATKEIKARWEAAEQRHGPLTQEQAENARQIFTAKAREQRYSNLMDQSAALEFCAAMRIDAVDPGPRITTFGNQGDARDFEPVWDYSEKRWRQVPEVYWDEIVRLQARGNQIFFYLNEARPGPGTGHNGVAKNENIEQVRCFSVDFDGGLPDSWDGPPGAWRDNSAREIDPRPDIVIHTSKRALPDGRIIRRGQALWLVHIFHEPCQRPGMPVMFKQMQQQFAAFYDPEGWQHKREEKWIGADGNPRGHITDKGVVDLRRVHRLPGTLHLKDQANPQLVTFERVSTRKNRRHPSDFSLYLPRIDDLEPSQPERVERERPATGDQDAVPLARLIEVLSYIDPGVAEPEWFETLCAIAGTPLLNGDSMEVARAWSAGEYDRRGDYAEAPPSNFKNAADVDSKFRRLLADRGDRPTKHFGSLVKAARENGYAGERREARADIFDQYLSGAAESPANDGIEILDFNQVRAIKPPAPIIPGLLYQGENVAIVAVMKSAKTFAALDISMSVASGLPVFGNNHGLVAEHVGAVVYCSAEGHGGMPARLDAWLQQRGAAGTPVPFYYIPQVPKARQKDSEVARFIAAIRAKTQGVTLVSIDTMARSIVGMDENSTDAASAYLDMTDYFVKELGCTCLTIAHASNKEQKNQKIVKPKDYDPDFRGSSGFGAGFDTTWTMLKADRGSIVRLQPKWSKNHELCDLRTFYLQLTPVLLPDGRKGATLELCDKIAYEAEWPRDEREATDSEKKASQEIDAIVLANEVHTVLKRAGACSGRSLAFTDQDALHASEWNNPIPASGGITLKTLAILILKHRGNQNPGAQETETMMKAIAADVGREGPLAQYHVQNRRGRNGGMIFALK